MERRAFLTTLTGSLLAAPLAAGAQQAEKVYRVGILSAGQQAPFVRRMRCSPRLSGSWAGSKGRT